MKRLVFILMICATAPTPAAADLSVEVRAQSADAVELPASFHDFRAAHNAMLADQAERHPK